MVAVFDDAMFIVEQTWHLWGLLKSDSAWRQRYITWCESTFTYVHSHKPSDGNPNCDVTHDNNEFDISSVIYHLPQSVWRDCNRHMSSANFSNILDCLPRWLFLVSEAVITGLGEISLVNVIRKIKERNCDKGHCGFRWFPTHWIRLSGVLPENI